MDAELTALEQKLDDMLSLCGRLRAENQELRARVAGLEGEKQRLSEKMDAARGRLESLVTRLPA